MFLPTQTRGEDNSLPLVVVVIIVAVGQAAVARVHHDLAGLAVLRADGYEEVALADDLNVRVTVRLQLFQDLGFGHWLVPGDEHRAFGLRRRDHEASRCNESGSTDQRCEKSTIHG